MCADALEIVPEQWQRAKQSDFSHATHDPSRMAVDGNIYWFGDYVKVVANGGRNCVCWE
jgi:hypothetical protein